MAKRDIKPGDRFGELIAIKESPERLYKEIAWECKCSCGEHTLATQGQLINGRKKSCGCLRKRSPANTIDMIGKRFGKLTVIERSGSTRNDNAQWLCECDCGGVTVANGTSLRRGDTVSCGCLNNDQINNAREVLAREKTLDGVAVPLLTKKVRSDSGTGHKGVHKRIRKGKEYFEVSITIKGKRKYIGTFKELRDAIEARKQAEKDYHEPYIKRLEGKEHDKRN